MIVTHPPCGARWPNADRRSHCTVCHRTFGGHTVADRHRVKGECLNRYDLEERGFVLREREAAGIKWAEWGGPDRPDDIQYGTNHPSTPSGCAADEKASA